MISNCGAPTEKVSELLDFQLKPVMHSDRSNVKDSGDFLKKIKNLGSLPENVILVTADVAFQMEHDYKHLKEHYKIDVIKELLLRNSLRWLNIC